MESIPRKRRRWKKKVSERRAAVKEMLGLSSIDDIDVKVALIQALIPEGLQSGEREITSGG